MINKGETAKFSVEIILSTKDKMELPNDSQIEQVVYDALRTVLESWPKRWLECLAVTVTGRTGEL